MALTIRMRIDDNDEHQYYYATGSGTEIELIPLVVESNGDYVPDEGKAYNKVTVNVPSTELETLIVNTNGTYNAPDGKAYNVVQVDVQSIINLQNKSASYTANGNYTIQADSGYDGLDTVSVEVNVPPTPTPSIQVSKSQTITQNGTVTVSPDSGYDAMEEAVLTVDVSGNSDVITHRFIPSEGINEIPVDIPSGKTLKALIVQPVRDQYGSNGYNALISANGKHVLANYTAIRDGNASTQWYFNSAYKETFSANNLTAYSRHTTMLNNPSKSQGIYAVCFNQTENKIKYNGRVLTSTSLEDYGLATTILYEYIIVLQ